MGHHRARRTSDAIAALALPIVQALPACRTLWQTDEWLAGKEGA